MLATGLYNIDICKTIEEYLAVQRRKRKKMSLVNSLIYTIDGWIIYIRRPEHGQFSCEFFVSRHQVTATLCLTVSGGRRVDGDKKLIKGRYHTTAAL